MKNTRFLFFLLLITASLILFSCGGLTSAKTETSSFSFSVDDAIVSTLARNGYPASTIFKIDAVISNTSRHTIKELHPEGTLAQLSGMPLVF